MNGFALVLVTAALGVDYGWQPSSDGRLEYIIQLEPVTLVALREGQEVLSPIDPYVKGIRRFRIRVGTHMVPRVGSPNVARQHTGVARWSPPAGVTIGWQPVDAQSLEFIVQLSPERIVLLKNGEEIVGEIPAEAGNVSRFRIRSASDPLPKQGLVGLSGAASYVSPASTPSRPTGQTPAGAPAVQAPAAAGVAPPSRGTAASAPTAAAAVPGSPSFAAQPQTGPTIAGPPRMTQPGATGALPVTNPAVQGGNPRFQPTQLPSGGVPPANAPVQGTATSPQHDPRSIYAPAASQPGGSGYAAAGTNPAPVQGKSWQQTPVQPDKSGGWSTTVDNAQSWPPPANRTVQGTGQASTGAHSGWDPRSTPSNSYAGTQYSGASPPLQSTDHAIPPAGPAYSPFATTGSPSGSNGGLLAGANGAYSPYGQPSLPVSQTASRYGPNAGLSNRQTAPEPGSDMVSIVSLSSKPRQQASPMDFWNSLAETASDPNLAYLRDDVYAADEEKAWWPLTLAMLALFASMGGNLYMGWIAVDVYRRYLDVATDDDEDDDDYRASDRDDDREDDWARDRRRRREPVTASGRAVA